MQAIQLGVIAASCLILGACAHQGGQSGAGSAQRSLDDRQQMSEFQDDNCQTLTPGTGETVDNRPLAVTDCDMTMVQRAVENKQRALESDWPEDMDSQGSPFPTGGVPRLPTSSGPELLGNQ